MKKDWTAGYCEDNQATTTSPLACTEYQDSVYKYNKSTLIKTVRTKDCMTSCKETEGCVAVNWKAKKCLLLSKAFKRKARKGWTAAHCA